MAAAITSRARLKMRTSIKPKLAYEHNPAQRGAISRTILPGGREGEGRPIIADAVSLLREASHAGRVGCGGGRQHEPRGAVARACVQSPSGPGLEQNKIRLRASAERVAAIKRLHYMAAAATVVWKPSRALAVSWSWEENRRKRNMELKSRAPLWEDRNSSPSCPAKSA